MTKVGYHKLEAKESGGMTGNNSVAEQAVTLLNVIEKHARQRPHESAILCGDRRLLTYGGLMAQVHKTAHYLSNFGLRRNDRVAIALPNGPDMAVCFLGVCAVATSAPLNPHYTQNEFEQYLASVSARLLIISKAECQTAASAAKKMGIPVVTLISTAEQEAGQFDLLPEIPTKDATLDLSRAEDEAYVMHSSGTTGRPKLISISQSNLYYSALYISRSLQLTTNDRSLNILPLFHVHGLVGAVCSSLFAGASVICTPGYTPATFFKWVETLQPSWYTAAPTIHQSIVARIRTGGVVLKKHQLRFIRSASSALSPKLMAQMEEAFGVPVIEASGMTECVPTASNPLPPGKRKAGSIGLPAGPEMAVMDEQGQLLPADSQGEIVVRGKNLTSCYNLGGGDMASAGTWFRTGDNGYIDGEGYVYLTGRLKEVIDRGGEKISPFEIDAVLLEHASVLEAVAFPVPDAQLGENVAAAVVLEKNASCTELELRQFIGTRLAHFKIPARIFFLDAIPKGPTGKYQRSKLAEMVGANAVGLRSRVKRQFVTPALGFESDLAAIWSEMLGKKDIGVCDDFFELGGNSLLAMQLIWNMEQRFGKSLPLSSLFTMPTIRQLAEFLTNNTVDSLKSGGMRGAGVGTPLFHIPGIWGYEFLPDAVAKCIGSNRPYYDGLQLPGFDGQSKPLDRIEHIVTHLVSQIRGIYPTGPYCLSGHSFGGTIALEVGRRLQSHGLEVETVVLLDSYCPGRFKRRSLFELSSDLWRYLSKLKPSAKVAYLMKLGSDKATMRRSSAGRATKAVLSRLNLVRPESLSARKGKIAANNVATGVLRAKDHYHPEPYKGNVVLFLAEDREFTFFFRKTEPSNGWKGIIVGDFRIITVPGDHVRMLREPNVSALASELNSCLLQTK